MSVTSDSTAPTSWLLIDEGSKHVDIDEAKLPYILLRNLGRGACSVVEEVRDRNTGLVYAHKVCYSRRYNKETVLALYKKELKIIRRLDKHHHIIRVFATHTAQKQFGLVLSPVADSGDMHDFLGEVMRLRRDPPRYKARLKDMTQILKRSFGCLTAGLAFIR